VYNKQWHSAAAFLYKRIEMNIQAVLFDCDGLMFNTEQVSQKMWIETAGKYGAKLSDGFFKAITGARRGSGFEQYKDRIPHLGEIMDEMKKRRFDYSYWASFYPDGLNKKGLVELNHFVHENDYRSAVCSSSVAAYVETLLKTVSQPMYFDTVIGGDMVVHGKPAPDIFLKGAEKLGIRPENCLVLEDSKQGIAAAVNAGMHSCFIEDTIVPDEEMKKNIEYRRDSLDQVISLLEELK
jgi:beta-phosphoglucomutase-like phosphatase (HAD superfamily)